MKTLFLMLESIWFSNSICIRSEGDNRRFLADQYVRRPSSGNVNWDTGHYTKLQHMNVTFSLVRIDLIPHLLVGLSHRSKVGLRSLGRCPPLPIVPCHDGGFVWWRLVRLYSSPSLRAWELGGLPGLWHIDHGHNGQTLLQLEQLFSEIGFGRPALSGKSSQSKSKSPPFSLVFDINTNTSLAVVIWARKFLHFWNNFSDTSGKTHQCLAMVAVDSRFSELIESADKTLKAE